jgi:hypothetical protein
MDGQRMERGGGTRLRRIGTLRVTACLGICLPIMAGGSAHSGEFWHNTFLLDVYQGSHRSDVASGLARGGYELSDGSFVDFRDWYSPGFPDVTVLLLKQVSSDFAFIWGVSSGERGEKYRIEPALQLGFFYQFVPFENAVVSVKTTYPFFGQMREKTCEADYGAIGGVQTVNCRLAADLMPPEETLDYLVTIRGKADARVSIGFTFVF